MTMKKYTCELVNPETGERRVVVVQLDGDELADIRRNYRTGDLIARSYAMRHASRSAPGFDPVIETIQPIQIH
jgi:hypothetical protein